MLSPFRRSRRRLLILSALLSGSLEAPLWAGEAALHFDGGQVVNAPPLPLGSHTIELWVRADGPLPPPSTPAAIFDWQGHTTLAISTAGVDYFIDEGGSTRTRLTTPPLKPGEWHHLAASYDFLRCWIFVDGSLAAAKILSGSFPRTGEAPAAFGAPLVGTTVPFKGSLDDIRFWNYPRNAEETEETLADHFLDSLPYASRSGLLAYWDLDEGAGQTAADLVGKRTLVLGDLVGPDGRDPLWTGEVSPVRKADAGLLFGFQPAGLVRVGAGKKVDLACTLTTLEGAAVAGVSAWSIAVRHERGILVLDNATLAGTAADDRAGDGFAHLEMLDDGASAGFTARVVLSGDGGRTLPPVGTATVARATYHGVVKLSFPALDGYVRYDSRLPSPSDGPPANSVRSGGATRLPGLESFTLLVTAPAFELALQPEEATLPPGGEITAACTLSTAGNTAATGPNAWSISVVHDSQVLELVEATTKGTALDRFTDSGAFLLTERVDNSSGSGFLSVAILNLSQDLSLPANGTETVARARYRVKDGAVLETLSRVAFVDGLQGSGVPVDNQVNFIGGAVSPALGHLQIRVARVPFLRGDANGDRSINISDVIFILNSLFRGAGFPPCGDAADVNDDGKVNISDPVFLLRYLFQAGARPPLPGPEPGEDPTADGLDCQTYPAAG
jgi:hypothetical protein